MVEFLSLDLAYLDLFWLGFFSLRQSYLEDSILIGCAYLVGVHARRKRNAPAECANVTFGALRVLPVLALSLALTADGQRVVMQRDIDVFLAHPGKFHDRDYVIVALVQIECGRPAGKELTCASDVRPERQLEKRVELISEGAPSIGRAP